MDTELAKMQEAVARIDERTGHILDGQEVHTKALAAHEERDRQDFKEVHARISAVDKRVGALSKIQSRLLGVGAAGLFVLTAVIAFFRYFIGSFGG